MTLKIGICEDALFSSYQHDLSTAKHDFKKCIVMNLQERSWWVVKRLDHFAGCNTPGNLVLKRKETWSRCQEMYRYRWESVYPMAKQYNTFFTFNNHENVFKFIQPLLIAKTFLYALNVLVLSGFDLHFQVLMELIQVQFFQVHSTPREIEVNQLRISLCEYKFQLANISLNSISLIKTTLETAANSWLCKMLSS